MLNHYAKLNICAMGMAIGLTWGFGCLFLSYMQIWFQMGQPMIDAIASIYLGYEATYLGGVIGLFWAFIDGFIGGIIVAFLYNKFMRCCPTCKGEIKKD